MPDKQDKQFDPTPHRLKKAREEGNVFRSKEVVSAGLLLAGFFTMVSGAPALFDTLQRVTKRLLMNAATITLDVGSAPVLFADIGMQLLTVMAPFFIILVMMSVGLNVVQSGWVLTLKPLVPKGENISPLKGLKRIFSSRGAFEFLKSVIKIAVVGPITYFFITRHLSEIVLLHTYSLEAVLEKVLSWIVALILQMLLALLALSGIDFAFEKWKHKEDLKMSKQEIKDEARQFEGDPHMKSKRRQVALEMARRPRLDHAVLKSDVVVTNPTHYAVALRYDPDEAAAPRVMIKGIRKRALRIKALAQELDVPTVENRPLARALYHNVDVEQEIPEDLYPAVAAILAEIYRDRDDHPGAAA